MGRNPYASIEDEPLDRAAVRRLRAQLTDYWEDTWLVTNPNGYNVVLVGNLVAILDTLLAGKELK